jgi:alcohol dehydrogenase (NADP+)
VNPERLKSNFDAANLELSTAEMEMIAGLDRHHRFIKGDFWTPLGSPYTLENLWDE